MLTSTFQLPMAYQNPGTFLLFPGAVQPEFLTQLLVFFPSAYIDGDGDWIIISELIWTYIYVLACTPCFQWCLHSHWWLVMFRCKVPSRDYQLNQASTKCISDAMPQAVSSVGHHCLRLHATSKQFCGFWSRTFRLHNKLAVRCLISGYMIKRKVDYSECTNTKWSSIDVLDVQRRNMNSITHFKRSSHPTTCATGSRLYAQRYHSFKDMLNASPQGSSWFLHDHEDLWSLPAPFPAGFATRRPGLGADGAIYVRMLFHSWCMSSVETILAFGNWVPSCIRDIPRLRLVLKITATVADVSKSNILVSFTRCNKPLH